MSDDTWKSVRGLCGDATYTMGPYFAYQALHIPRHLLFTLARYKFAARMLQNSPQCRVLELGCGEGFGTLMLAEDGHLVTGVDFDEEAITQARASVHNTDKNITFMMGDIMNQQYGQFDAVVSLDVIEHIATGEDEQEYLQTILMNLSPHGFCVIGTPNETAAAYASEPSRRGHINLFSAERLRSTLGAYFHNVFMFGMNDEVVHTGYYPMCHYLFVLACGKREVALR